VPRDLETICLKCLDKDGHRRYATAAALAEDLGHFLAGEPIAARPVSLWRRTGKWARRRPAFATLLAVVAVSVLALASAVAWSGVREARRLANLRTEVQAAARAGQKAFAAQDWSEARYQLARALTRIGGEEALADLRGPLEEMHAEAGRRLTERQARDRADAAHRDFLSLRDRALFHGMVCLSPGMLFTGMDAAANRQAAEDGARAALARVGLEVDRDVPWTLDANFTPAQAAEIRAGAHAVLFVLADVTAQQGSAELPPEKRYDRALRVLERARAVGAPARACGQRRAVYLERLLGDSEAADRERARMAALSVTNDLDHLLAGQEHYQAGRLPEAVREFKKVLAAEPQHFWARCYLAFCDLRRQDWERAWDNLTVCLSQRPDFVKARLLRGYAHLEAGAYEEAALDFRQAEQLLQRQPNAEATYYLRLNRGLLFYRQGKLAAAAADLREAIRLRPHDYAPHLNLARVYQRQAKEIPPAAGASAVALLGSPLGGQRPFLAVAALCVGPAGKRAQAAAELRQVVASKPPPLVLADYHAERGRDLYRDGRHEEAVAACRLALKQQPDYPFALGVLAQTLIELRRFGEAAEAFDRYLAKGGRPVADVFRGRGQARMQLGDYLGAVADYTRVLERHPGAEIRAHRGWAYFFADAWRPALADFEQALALDPAYGDAYTGRGLARVMLGQHRAAVRDAEEARHRRPTTPEMMHNVACIYSLAAGKVVQDPKEKDAPALAGRYRTAAVRALRDTLALVRPAERAQFWREKMLPDNALDPIRNSAEFRELVREMGGTR
jgi:tetratricopeptide (TPR) repeat protein